MSGVGGTGPDLEANLTLGIRPPQPSHDPLSHIESSRADTRAEERGTEVLISSTAAQAIQEQDVAVRNGDHHVEEGIEVEEGIDVGEDMDIEEGIDVEECIDVGEDIDVEECIDVGEDIDVEEDIDVGGNIDVAMDMAG